MNRNAPTADADTPTPGDVGAIPIDDRLPDGLTEETYLAAEVERRREDLAGAVSAAIERLREARNLRRWVRRYPWPTVGAAAAAGFAAATVVTPAKGEKLSDKLNRLSSHTAHTHSSPAATPASPAALAGAPFAIWSIVHALFDLAKALVARTAEQPAAARTNGAAAAHAAPPNHDRP